MYGAPFLPVSALNSSQDSARGSKSGVIRHCCYSCFSRFRVFLYSENTKTRIPQARNPQGRAPQNASSVPVQQLPPRASHFLSSSLIPAASGPWLPVPLPGPDGSLRRRIAARCDQRAAGKLGPRLDGHPG